MGLTVKQENFCNYYVESGNASEALRRAYSCNSMADKTINEKACRMLKESKISARIAELQGQLKDKSDITKEGMLKELANIVNVRITSIGTIKDNVFIVKSLNNLPDEIISAIQSIKQTNNGLEVKLYDKISAIDRISKMLGWDSPVKSNNNVNVRIIVGDE